MAAVWLGWFGSTVIGCGLLGGHSKPEWVDGKSVEYPADQYLTGVGQGDSRAVASDQAYAAVSRIFQAQVEAQAKDWESYIVLERREMSNTERTLTIDNLTKVSTDKVLENVRITDAWYDAKTGVHYALALMNRAQAEASLMERISVLDRTIAADVTEARQTDDKLAKVRALRRSVGNVMVREAYNADLRVIRSSGRGIPSPYQVNELSGELEQFLARNLALDVQVSGDHAELIQLALTDGLIRKGFRVTNGVEREYIVKPELFVRGAVRLFPVDMRDPQFKYARWCGDFDVVDAVSQRVVGVVARGGKEGHVTDQEAAAKALRVMQREISSSVAESIAASIFGDVALPTTVVAPAGCPREAVSGKR